MRGNNNNKRPRVTNFSKIYSELIPDGEDYVRSRGIDVGIPNKPKKKDQDTKCQIGSGVDPPPITLTPLSASAPTLRSCVGVDSENAERWRLRSGELEGVRGLLSDEGIELGKASCAGRVRVRLADRGIEGGKLCRPCGTY